MVRGLAPPGASARSARLFVSGGIVLAHRYLFTPGMANSGVQVDGLRPAALVSWSRGRAVV